MGKSTISEQAEKYAEIIVRQIADNFHALQDKIEACEAFKKVAKEYQELSPNDTTLMEIKKVQQRLDVIERHIGDLICDKHHMVEPLAVGLFGEWGTGKTYQLKQIQHKVLQREILQEKEQDKSVTFPQVTIPVFFNAWRFEKEPHMIVPLFQTLLHAVENHERSFKEKIGRSLHSTLFHLKNILFSLHKGLSLSSAYTTVEGVLTNDAEKMAEVSKILDFEVVNQAAQSDTDEAQVGEQTLSELLKPDRLESIYLNIPQWIEKITLFEKVNFVFLIDDLDRCLPENTLKMLESIKLFLDVPSCAFVLAVDDDVVERGVVHHYRDYLSIYHHKDTQDAKETLQHELPITGHEYLEKMIQLPIRLPVIDTQNVLLFLEEQSSGWIAHVDKGYHVEGAKGDGVQPSRELLAFFAEVIPPKPRKIKRVASLFLTKLELLEALGLEGKVTYKLIAKITLLELFAPKLLRVIQNNDYGMVYNALCHFQEIEYIREVEKQSEEELENGEEVEKETNSLTDARSIRKYIQRNKEDDPSAYTQKVQDILMRVMRVVAEHYTSRVSFDLDKIFDERVEHEKLQIVIGLSAYVAPKVSSKRSRHFDEDFYQRVFRENDVDAWRTAWQEHDALLSAIQLEEMIEQATEREDSQFNTLPFIANPEWVAEVAKYVDEEGYKVLLKASHKVRFKTIKDTIQIDSFQLTFAEYDIYCVLADKEKPDDEGWGRGRRPVINVSWHEAKGYTEWLSDFLKVAYRLPTEEEWEWACNKGSKARWHFGEDETVLKEYAWYDENAKGKTHPVGEKKPNAFELYDMHGNVWEWCEGWYDKDENKKNLRGGSWNSYVNLTRSAYRVWYYPSIRSYDVGFRLLRTLP